MLAGLFKSRSLLFVFVTLVRFVGILAMFMLVISQFLNIANNIKGSQRPQDDSKTGTDSPSSSLTSSSSSSATLTSSSDDITSTATPTSSPVATSKDNARALKVRQATGSPVETPTTATEIVQPDKTLQSRIDEAASSQSQRLVRDGESGIPTGWGMHMVSADDNDEGHSSNLFRGTDVPRETGGLAFILIERFITIFVLFFLIVSEMSPPRVSAWYERQFPPLGPLHGVGWLGILMVWIGAACLSHATSLNFMAYEFQRAVSWMVFIVGLINCAFGVLLFESIRPFRSLLPSDQPQNDFESYSSTQGHGPPMRSVLSRPSESRDMAATAASVSDHQDSPRKSFKGFGPRKSLFLIGNRSASDAEKGIRPTASLARTTSGSTTGSVNSNLKGFAISRPQPLGFAAAQGAAPPTYHNTEADEHDQAESLAQDPRTDPAIQFAQR